MALVKNPLFTLQASGSVGHAVTFAKQKGRSIAKSLAVPTGDPSSAQDSQRIKLGQLAQLFKTWSSAQADREAWRASARLLSRAPSPYHAVIRAANDALTARFTATLGLAVDTPHPAQLRFLMVEPLTNIVATDPDPYTLWIVRRGTAPTPYETLFPSSGFVQTSSLPAEDPAPGYFLAINDRPVSGLYYFAPAPDWQNAVFVADSLDPDWNQTYLPAGTYNGYDLFLGETHPIYCGYSLVRNRFCFSANLDTLSQPYAYTHTAPVTQPYGLYKYIEAPGPIPRHFFNAVQPS